MKLIDIFMGKGKNKESAAVKAATESGEPNPPKAAKSDSGLKKTLPKDIEAYIHDDEAVKAAFSTCDINAYGGFNAGNIFFFFISEEMMEWCLARGADINYRDRYDYTPLHYHSNSVKGEEQALLLIKHGADVNVADRLMKESPLFFAVRVGNLKLIDVLLEKGADLNAVNFRGYTPLEALFAGAMPIDLPKVVTVTRFLVERGAVITDMVKAGYLRVAKDIEFRRKEISNDFIDKIDEAMDSLYEMLQVERVPRRQEYDGKSPIVVTETSWGKQHAELWNLLVPGSGRANTVQGEVIRITGKACYEILDNGAMNWDNDYREMIVALKKYLQMGERLSDEEYAEIAELTKDIKNKDEEDLNRLTELSVKWVVKNPNPMALGEVEYTR